MRVAILAWGLPPHGSGLGRAAMEIARGLADIGCDVTIFDAGRPQGETRNPTGLSIIGCDTPQGGLAGFLRKRLAIGHLVAPWYFRKAIQRAHQANPFDIIEATNWYAPAACLAFGTIPHVVRNSTPAISGKGEHHGLRHRLDLWFAHKLESWTARHADALISNTAPHAAVIQDLYNVREPQVHQVISLALDPQVLKRGAAAALPSTIAIPSLLFVGRAERRKGFEEMLDGYLIANKARKAAGHRSIRLTIVGVDPVVVTDILIARNASSEAAQGITILNGLSDDDLHAQYEEATAVIAPSRYESFGLVYREAAAFGRPLIACPEDPAARDFIRDAKCGVLAQSCTPEGIADAIDQFMGVPDDWDEFAKAGRQHVQKLTRENLARQTFEVYEHVIASQSPRRLSEA